MSTTQSASGTSFGEVCRLTICGPSSRIELGVPANVPLADLMPTFLGHLGPELANTGLSHGGWVLQRIGEPALDEDLGTTALGLCDGDVLHLRPRAEQLPPAAFDDLVDGVATGMATRGSVWKPATTKATLLVVAGLTLLAALLLTTVTPDTSMIALGAGSSALVLLLGTVAARAADDGHVAVLLAVAATAFAAFAGAVLPVIGRDSGVLDALGTSPGVTSAAACATAALVAGWSAVGARVSPSMAGALVVSLLVTIGGLASVQFGLTVHGAAAVVIVVALVVGVRAPLLAARMARLRIPPLPTTSEEFQEDLEPEPSTEVLDRTALADRYLTSLHIGLGVLLAGATGALVLGTGWAPAVLAAVVSLLALVHARDLVGVWQRLPLVLAATLGLVGLVFTTASRSPGAMSFAMPALILGAAGFCYAARALPGRKVLPHWGRVADIAQTVLAVSVLPIVLAVLDVYGKVRAAWS